MHSESPVSTRRDFLLSTGVFAAAAINPAVRAQQEPPAAKPQALPQVDEEALDPSHAVDGVTPKTIAEAEKLANITFTDQERQQIAASIAEQLDRSKARLKHGFHPNDLPPAMRFDPRLLHVENRKPQSASRKPRVIARHFDPGPLPQDDADIAFAPLATLSQWIRQKQLTSTRLTEIYMNRIKKFDPQLKAVITLCEDNARAQAKAADHEIANGRYRGSLHGIPWGAKDLLDTANIRTTWGAEPFQDRVPQQDAEVVTLLNKAGAVLIAKLSLGALAYNDIWFGGRTNNPWNLKQGSSGSSAGSAAATAAGLVGFSIGSETYGSITSPCMRCGATGLRPTFGRVSRAGAMALCWSLDKLGPICRSVEDCIYVLDAINGSYPSIGDPCVINEPLGFNAAQPIEELKVGFNPKWFEDPPAIDLDRNALEAMKKTGVQLVEVDIPDWPYDSLLSILMCEAAAAFEELTRTNQDDSLTWQDAVAWPNTFRKAWFIPGIEVIQADRLRRKCMHMMADVFANAGIHAIIAPSFAANLCLITNNTGHPSITLRCGFRTNREGVEVPYGITLIGDLFEEGTMCRAAHALENELNVTAKRPPLV